MPSELLVEIGCEEIPARFLPPTLEQLEKKAKAAFEKSKIGHSKITTFGTPRRIGIAVNDMADTQESWEESKTGPFVNKAFDESGKPTKAAEGFARSCGVTIEELSRTETKKGEKLYFSKTVEGKDTKDVLCAILPELIMSLDFPRSMRWGYGDLTFARPIHWVLSIFSGECVEFDLGGIKSGNKTRGHRFTHPEELEITNFDEYLKKLAKANVLPLTQNRNEIILESINKKADELGGMLLADPELTKEVTNIVEYPVVISGGFDKKYLAIPPEVLISCMRTHQRYFAVIQAGTKMELLPNFIAVANTPAKDINIVIKGNERVLDARLADAEFYYEEDKKTGIEKMREQTSGMLFYKTLGSYMDKTVRLAKLAEELSGQICPGNLEVKDICVKAANYCKADLTSQMVGEFPELQGIMGGEYTNAARLDEQVSLAVRDHYLPRSAEDISNGNYPQTTMGKILSICDKVDSLVTCWAAGLAPTGAGDPFALRRQVQGIINLILTKELKINIPQLITCAADLCPAGLKKEGDELISETIDFLLTRLKVQLTETGLAYDAVDACFAVWNGDILDTVKKIKAVSALKKRDDFEDLMIAFRRVMNIVEGTPDKVDSNLFADESEAVLYSEYTRVNTRVNPLLSDGSYDDVLDIMVSLKTSVDSFFKDVMVNVDDQELRRNRQALCYTIANLFKKVADFSKIVIEGEKTARN